MKLRKIIVLFLLPFALTSFKNKEKLADYHDTILLKNSTYIEICSLLYENPDKLVLNFDYIENSFSIYELENDRINSSTLYIENGILNEEAKEYYESWITKKNNNLEPASTNSSTLIDSIGTRDIRIMDKPYGYIDFTIRPEKYRFSDNASLYFIKVQYSFVTGNYASFTDPDDFENYTRNNGCRELLGLKASQDQADVGYADMIYSGVPVLKDYYPMSSPVSVTINSSYESSTEIGVSTTAGFEGLVPKVEVSGSYTYQSVTSYSKTYTLEEPQMTSSYSLNERDLVQWRFNYFSNGGVADYPNNGEACVIVEINNVQDNRNVENEFLLRIDYISELVNGNKNHTIEGYKYIHWN